MKFTINSKELYSKLQNAGRVISNKNTIPVLDCFLLGLDGNELKIAASDLEIRVSTIVQVTESFENGTVCVDAKTILDGLRELPEQPLNIQVNQDNLEVIIEYHNGKYTFIGQDAKDYPQPNKLNDEGMKLSINPQILLTGINRSLFASADDELRPVMNGVYFDITTEDLTFVASDGHKLVRNKTKAVKGQDRASFILPKKPANLLRAILPKENNDIEVTFDENNAYVKMSNYTMICRFIEGRYPNYNSVIPTSNPYSFEVSRDVLLATVKRISTLGNKATNLVKFDLSESKLIVSSQDIDFSTAAEENINIEYSGVPMDIGFKSTFLVEILSSIQSEEVYFDLSDPTKAAIIKPASNSEGWDNLALLMPMMLNE